MAVPNYWTVLVAVAIFRTIDCDVIVEQNGYTSYTQKLAYTSLNRFQVQFKTLDNTGLLLHAQGGSYYVTLELVGGKIRYASDLGKTYDSYGEVASGFHELYVGQGLADNEWHNVVLTHNEDKQRVNIEVNNLKELEFQATRTIPPGAVKLGVEYIHVGGMKFTEKASMRESLARKGFKGCIRNSTFNGKSIIDGVNVRLINANVGECPMKPFFNSIDFPMNGSYVSYNYSGAGVATSFGFKTKEPSQQLFYTSLMDKQDKFFLRLEIEGNGGLSAYFGSSRVTSKVVGMHDGLWHNVELSFSSTKPFMLELVVDGQKSNAEMQQVLNVKDMVYFGRRYVGCMRNVLVNGKKLLPEDFDKYGPFSLTKYKESLRPAFGKCALKELCVPNPCLHGGKCRQGPGDSFSCDCTNTGYKGNVCSKALYHRSCMAIKEAGKAPLTSGKQFIDVDGIGPLSKVEVECIYGVDKVITQVNTKLPANVAVENRFGMKSIRVSYEADQRSLKSITKESVECQQHVRYVCTKSSLFNTPRGPPKVHWLGPESYFHYYWGGSKGKIDHCRCGVYSNCTDRSRYCNCDARSSKETTDEGYLSEKKHLPMRKIEFLDVNSELGSKGRFSLGPLRCSGDSSTDDAVSFRDGMAYLQVKPTSVTDYNNAIDAMTVSLSFKTTNAEGVMFYAKGRTSSDFIMIRILSKKRLRGEINLGSGADFVDIDIAGNFDDNKAHSLFLEFNRHELMLTVDSVSKTVQRDSTSMTHLDLDGEPMFIGGGYGIAEGFTGCIMGLYLNGMMVDIKSTTKYLENNGVHAGCGIGCNRPSIAPCNYGKCIEKYTTFTCDCSLSPFDGRYCHKESYPLHFKRNSSLMYTFKTPVQIKQGEAIVAFKTNNEDGLIFSIHGDKPNCHLSLVMQDGGLEVAFNFDTTSTSNEIIKVQSGSGKKRFDDGKRHSIKVFHDAKKVIVQVLDGRSTGQMKITNSGDDLIDGVKISIGGVNPPLQSPVGKANRFTGCMSSFKYKYLVNMASKPVLVDVFALYGKKDPVVGGNAVPGACGKSLPVPPPLPILMGRPTKVATTVHQLPRFYEVSRDYTPIIIGVACGLAFLLLVLLILFCKHINRNLGAYKTYEDRRPISGAAETSFTPSPDSVDGSPRVENSEAKGTKKKELYV